MTEEIIGENNLENNVDKVENFAEIKLGRPCLMFLFVASPADHVIAQISNFLIGVVTISHIEAGYDQFQPPALQLLKNSTILSFLS